MTKCNQNWYVVDFRSLVTRCVWERGREREKVIDAMRWTWTECIVQCSLWFVANHFIWAFSISLVLHHSKSLIFPVRLIKCAANTTNLNHVRLATLNALDSLLVRCVCGESETLNWAVIKATSILVDADDFNDRFNISVPSQMQNHLLSLFSAF